MTEVLLARIGCFCLGQKNKGPAKVGTFANVGVAVGGGIPSMRRRGYLMDGAPSLHQ